MKCQTCQVVYFAIVQNLEVKPNLIHMTFSTEHLYIIRVCTDFTDTVCGEVRENSILYPRLARDVTCDDCFCIKTPTKTLIAVVAVALVIINNKFIARTEYYDYRL